MNLLILDEKASNSLDIKIIEEKQLMKLYLLVLMAANFGSAVFCMFTLNYMLFATPNHGLWMYESNKYVLTGEAISSIIFVSLTVTFVIREALKKYRTLLSPSSH